MQWFDKWFYKKCRAAWENSKKRSESAIPANLVAPAQEPNIHANGLTFTVYRANGGYVIEHRRYNFKKDCNDTGLHIITEDKDLGAEIGKIITFETIRS